MPGCCAQVWELDRSIVGSSLEVATIAANGDEHIGKMITEAFEKAASEGIEKVCSCLPVDRSARMGPSPCPTPSWIWKQFHKAPRCPSCVSSHASVGLMAKPWITSLRPHACITPNHRVIGLMT